AYRALEFNEINGNEKRLLNGVFLDSEYGRYGIVDSTPEKEADFGNAFHLFIPKKLVYGYPWSRSGEVTVEEGTFINIRTFEKPYADYSGAYADNPFMFGFNAALTDEYSPAAAEAFKDIASGILIYSHGPDTIVEDVMRSFKELPKDQNADVVFAVDATGSMWDDIQKLQKELIPALASELQGRAEVRLGLLFYRDYTDDFRYRGLPVQFNDFTRDAEAFFSKLNAMHIPRHSLIGGDTPEAVYEALYASLEFYRWSPFAHKKIILIGDAEPHPSPRAGKGISKKLVEDTTRKKEVTIDCIIIPDGKAGTR
ncbi:MAG: VWA domain-containing protein, partial [Treponema maltophilum]